MAGGDGDSSVHGGEWRERWTVIEIHSRLMASRSICMHINNIYLGIGIPLRTCVQHERTDLSAIYTLIIA